MTDIIRYFRNAAPAFRKNTISALRALYVGASVAAYLAAMLWIASRRS